MLLAVVSCSAVAEWVRVNSSDNGNSIVYADPSTLRKENNMVKMSILLDSNTAEGFDANGKVFRSIQEQKEFDCKERKERVLYATAYSGNVGKGKVISSGKPTRESTRNWNLVSPDTLEENLWKIACQGALNDSIAP